MSERRLTFEEWLEVNHAIESSEGEWERLKSNPHLKQRSINALRWLKSAKEKLRSFMG
ncbi:MAG: hypothetical protein AM325_016425 [Candidatus Thorarchaeota archaeon SMTZ1-45]